MKSINGRKRVKYLVAAGKMMKTSSGWRSYHSYDNLSAAKRFLSTRPNGYQIDVRGRNINRRPFEFKCLFYCDNGVKRNA